jgi:hypothetical protein
VEAFNDLEDGNDGNSVVTEGVVIAGGSSDNVLINPFQNLGEDIRAVLVGRTALGANQAWHCHHAYDLHLPLWRRSS